MQVHTSVSCSRAWASPQASTLRERFGCHPARPGHRPAPMVIHGDDPMTRAHADDLLWATREDRMLAAGHFLLAEVSCGAGCIQLGSIDLRTGNVRWLPETISNWPIRSEPPVRYRSDSRLVIVFGQLDERGTTGPFHYILTTTGFHRLPDDRVCRTR